MKSAHAETIERVFAAWRTEIAACRPTEAGNLLTMANTVLFRDAFVAGAEAGLKLAAGDVTRAIREAEATLQAVLAVVHKLPPGAITGPAIEPAWDRLVSVCRHLGHPIGGDRARKLVAAGPIPLIPRPT